MEMFGTIICFTTAFCGLVNKEIPLLRGRSIKGEDAKALGEVMLYLGLLSCAALVIKGFIK